MYYRPLPLGSLFAKAQRLTSLMSVASSSVVQYLDRVEVQQGQPVFDAPEEADDATDTLPDMDHRRPDGKVEQLVSFDDGNGGGSAADGGEDRKASVASIREDIAETSTQMTTTTTVAINSSSELMPDIATSPPAAPIFTLEDPTQITFTAAKEVPLAALRDGRPPSTPLLSTPPPPGLSSPLHAHSPATSSPTAEDGSPRHYDRFEAISRQGFEDVLFESEM